MRYFLTVSLLAFFLTSFSQIPYNTFAEVKTPNPWDGRDSLTTLADTASYGTNIKYPGLLAYAYDVSQLWMWNGTKWVFLFDENGAANQNIAQDTSVQLTYLPSHNYTDGTLYAIKADFTRASAEFADSIHTAFIVGAPDADSVQIQYAGRYTETGHGFAVGKLYYLTDDTADQFDTIPGSFTDPVFIVLDANTLELLNQGTDVNSNIIRRVIPSPFITAYGGDPFAPTDSVIQALIEGVYVPTGRAAPGTIFLTQSTGASRNNAHVASAADPSTPANMWYWDGALATRNNYAQQSISLSDTVYGTLFNIPLDTVQLIGGIPTDSTVANWLETNYTDNNLRIPNGTLLYWVGSGTKRSPDYIWQVVDDLTPDAVGTDQWDNIIKRISSPGGKESSGLVGELQYSDGNGGFISNDKITHSSNVILLDNDDDSGDVSLAIHNFDAGTGLLGDELDWNVTIQNGFTYRTRGTDNATLYTSSRSYTADNTDPNQVIGQWVVQSYNNSGLLNTNAGGFRFLNIDQTNSYSNFHLWGKSTLDKELIYTGETGALKLEGYADAGISTAGTYSRLLAVQTDGSVVPITAPSGADGNGIYDGSDELPGTLVDVVNTAGLRISDPNYATSYSQFYNDFDNPIGDESFHTGIIFSDSQEFEDTTYMGYNQNGFEIHGISNVAPISIRTGNYAGLFSDSVSLRIGVNGVGGKQNILQDNSANKRGLEYYGYGENASTGVGGNYDDVLARPNSLPPVAAVAEMISDSLSGFSGGSGDVTGPGSSTDNTVVRFNGTGGDEIQGSGVVIDDSDNITTSGTMTITSNGSTATTLTGRDASETITDVTIGTGLSLSSGTLNNTVTDTDDQTAGEVNATDVGEYYTGTQLEAITQEIGASLLTHQNILDTIGTGFTEGLVAFGKTGGGRLSQDNNFYYLNNRLRVGTSSFVGSESILLDGGTGATDQVVLRGTGYAGSSDAYAALIIGTSSSNSNVKVLIKGTSTGNSVNEIHYKSSGTSGSALRFRGDTLPTLEITKFGNLLAKPNQVRSVTNSGADYNYSTLGSASTLTVTDQHPSLVAGTFSYQALDNQGSINNTFNNQMGNTVAVSKWTDQTSVYDYALFRASYHTSGTVTANPYLYLAEKDSVDQFRVSHDGIGYLRTSLGIGTTSPTAKLHLAAGSTSTSTSPLKFTSGSLLTTPEVGSVEFLTNRWYGTITTGTSRETFAFLSDITRQAIYKDWIAVPYNGIDSLVVDTTNGFFFVGQDIAGDTLTEVTYMISDTVSSGNFQMRLLHKKPATSSWSILAVASITAGVTTAYVTGESEVLALGDILMVEITALPGTQTVSGITKPNSLAVNIKVE